MHDAPRQKLRELIIEYGRSLCDDPRRCEALLKDYCGQHKREIFVLISALKNRVADDLLKTSTNVPQSLLFARLHKRLEDELAMTAEAAQWAVETWALALEVINQPLSVVSPTPASPTPKVAPAPLPHTEAPLIAGRYRDNLAFAHIFRPQMELYPHLSLKNGRKSEYFPHFDAHDFVWVRRFGKISRQVGTDTFQVAGFRPLVGDNFMKRVQI